MRPEANQKREKPDKVLQCLYSRFSGVNTAHHTAPQRKPEVGHKAEGVGDSAPQLTETEQPAEPK